jgi:transcriptional regulator with XRE-family HTH domain
MFLEALRNVAEAKRMSNVAKKAGVSRESLYRTLSGKGNPRFDTLTSVLSVLGLQLKLEAFSKTAPAVTPSGSELSSTIGPPYQAPNPKAEIKSLGAHYLLSDQYLRMASAYVASNSEIQWWEWIEQTPLSMASARAYTPGTASGVLVVPVNPAPSEAQTPVFDASNQPAIGSLSSVFSPAAA